MQYKVRYRPLEKLSRSGWVRFDPDEQIEAIRTAVSRDEPPLPIELAGIFRK
jgi:arginine-tRNA-protein transferase